MCRQCLRNRQNEPVGKVSHSSSNMGSDVTLPIPETEREEVNIEPSTSTPSVESQPPASILCDAPPISSEQSKSTSIHQEMAQLLARANLPEKQQRFLLSQFKNSTKSVFGHR